MGTTEVGTRFCQRLPFVAVYRLVEPEHTTVEFNSLIFLHGLFYGLGLDLTDERVTEIDCLGAAERELGIPYGFWDQETGLLTINRFGPAGQVLVKFLQIELPPIASDFFSRLTRLLEGWELKLKDRDLIKCRRRLQESYLASTRTCNPVHALITAVASASSAFALPPTISLLSPS